MSSAQGNGAVGSTVGEGVKVAVACSVTVRMTSWGSESSVPSSVRMELREARGAPWLSFCVVVGVVFQVWVFV